MSTSRTWRSAGRSRNRKPGEPPNLRSDIGTVPLLRELGIEWAGWAATISAPTALIFLWRSCDLGLFRFRLRHRGDALCGHRLETFGEPLLPSARFHRRGRRILEARDHRHVNRLESVAAFIRII